jgi:uncharacterized protein YjbI with pentapeptide repeats
VATLHGTVDLTDATIIGDFSGCELIEPVFRECRVERAQFIGGRLRYARFVDCVFVDSDLSGATLEECSMTRVEFRGCRASALQVFRGRLADVGFSGCKLDGANFRMTTWEKAEFSECDLSEADFYASKLPNSRILNCDLSRVEFSKADLGGSRLAGSHLDGLRGAASLGRVAITSDQVIALAMALFASHRITVTD